MKSLEDRLLREYVKAILAEDDTGGYGYYPSGIGGMAGGFGMMNYGDSLKSVFIEPFVDAGKVIKASGSKALLRVKTLAKVAIETILTTTIPFLQSNYQQIFANEREQIKKLREKYKKHFEGVDKAFTGDAMLIAFMVSPEAFITTKFVQKAPELAVGLLETLSVGNENMEKYFQDVKKRLQLINKELKDDISNYKVGSQGEFVRKNARGPYMTQKKRDLLKKAGIPSTVSNAAVPGVSEGVRPDPRVELVTKILKDPFVMEQVLSSPLAQAMRDDAKGFLGNVSSKLLAEARRTLAVRSLQDLESVTGKRVNVPGLESVQGPDRVALEEAVTKQVQAAMKEFYVVTLRNEIESLERSGVGPNNLYIRALRNTLSKVAAL